MECCFRDKIRVRMGFSKVGIKGKATSSKGVNKDKATFSKAVNREAFSKVVSKVVNVSKPQQHP